eukprot:jgi/Tetstr1/449412/TSEL_036507.t1
MQCAFMRTHGQDTFADPTGRWMTTRFSDEAAHHDAACAMPLCYAAKHGLAGLVAWLLERQHHGRGRRVACLRVTRLAAANGHLALAKVKRPLQSPARPPASCQAEDEPYW